MPAYVVVVPKYSQRPNVQGGGTLEVTWVVQDFYGSHSTNIEAKRAYMESLEPDLKGAPDSFIRAHFDAQARNLAHAKIRKIPSASV